MAEAPQITPIKLSGFGSESISRYLEWAVNNISTTHHHNPELYQRFVRIDNAFIAAFQNLSDFGDDFVFGLLLIRAHCAFRGACMMSMSGQSVEAYMLMRGCLEAALYALHMEANPGLWEIWLNRDQHKEKCRQEFKYGVVKKTLELKSKKHFNIMSRLYEITIDLGAHPNEQSLTPGLQINRDDDKRTMSIQYAAADSAQVSHAWRKTSQAGVCALHTMQLARPGYFKRLGIDAMIDNAAKGL